VMRYSHVTESELGDITTVLSTACEEARVTVEDYDERVYVVQIVGWYDPPNKEAIWHAEDS
jgi:hypothetical protein